MWRIPSRLVWPAALAIRAAGIGKRTVRRRESDSEATAPVTEGIHVTFLSTEAWAVAVGALASKNPAVLAALF